MKIYLDTNIILDFFINQIRHIKQKKELQIPKKFQFLSENLDKIKLYTSFLTKTEVMRKLKSEFSATTEDVEIIWNKFIKLLACGYIKRMEFDEGLISITSQIPMKRKTVINFQHLFIAKSLGYYFLSGDKEAVRKMRKMAFYDKIITYEELRQRFAPMRS